MLILLLKVQPSLFRKFPLFCLGVKQCVSFGTNDAKTEMNHYEMVANAVDNFWIFVVRGERVKKPFIK